MPYTAWRRWLYKLKEKLEDHLCRRTDSLFDTTNRIALLDMTNFYFEGRKDGSKKAQFGRSKEKRSDCKLLVLALCVNQEGSILAGNTADPNSPPDMVDTLAGRTRVPHNQNDRVLVCLDAGITTEDNLKRIKDKGCNYLCVSRRRLTGYELSEDAETVKAFDSKNQYIKLTRVRHEDGGDYYLKYSHQPKP